MAHKLQCSVGKLRRLMPRPAHLTMLGIILLFSAARVFADDIPFTVTTDSTTLAGEDEVIFGYQDLTSSEDLYTSSLSVDLTGPGSFDPSDAADNGEYGFNLFAPITTDSAENFGYLGVYLAPIGYTGSVTLDFDIGTLLSDFSAAGPDYTAAYTFTYQPVSTPEPGTLALLASEGVTGLAWFGVLAMRRRNRRKKEPGV